MTRPSRRRALLAATASACLPFAVPSAVRAQAPWPSKPLRIMVGANAGGGTDIIARMLAEKLSAQLGQQVVVENRPGASNTIAADLTAKAPPDGHTLLAATNTGQAIAPHLIKLAFDPIKDISPIALIVEVPNVLVVNPSLPAKSVADLVALAKSKPGEITYGTSGVASPEHFAGEMFKMMTGTNIAMIPYKGGGPLAIDLVGGHLMTSFSTMPPIIPHVKAGRVRAIAVTMDKRAAVLPEVPTIAETVPGYATSTWYGAMVPAKTSREIVTKLSQAMLQALALPDVKERLAALGAEIVATTPEQTSAFFKTELTKYTKVARAAGIKGE